MLKTNGGTYNATGSGNETLDEQTLAMFRAIRQDKLAEFVFYNPEVISNRK